MATNNFPIKENLIQALNKKGIFNPTPIQALSIPQIKLNKNYVVVAPTGTGKTFCYLLPILNDVNPRNQIHSIIVLPTKELARQVYQEVKFFYDYIPHLRCLLINEKDHLEKSLDQLTNNQPDILIITAGQLKNLLNYKRIILKPKFVILDEADMLLDLGFISTVNNLFDNIKTSCCKIALSATLHESLANSFKNYLSNATILKVGDEIWNNPNIKHYLVHEANNFDKISILKKLLKQLNPYFCIIFVNTVREANEVYRELKKEYRDIGLLHKDLQPRERKNTYKNAKDHKYQYLVATDLISRGLDIDGASDVISLDFNQEDIWYMHRSGRVGRKSSFGNSYVIYHSDKQDEFINRLSKKGIEWSFLSFKDNQLIEKQLNIRNRKKVILPNEVNKEIKKIVNTSKGKVKPNYKKKLKQKIHKIKQKEKRKYLDEIMKRGRRG